jgi:hypothetical protein
MSGLTIADRVAPAHSGDHCAAPDLREERSNRAPIASRSGSPKECGRMGRLRMGLAARPAYSDVAHRITRPRPDFPEPPPERGPPRHDCSEHPEVGLGFLGRSRIERSPRFLDRGHRLVPAYGAVTPFQVSATLHKFPSNGWGTRRTAENFGGAGASGFDTLPGRALMATGGSGSHGRSESGPCNSTLWRGRRRERPQLLARQTRS